MQLKISCRHTAFSLLCIAGISLSAYSQSPNLKKAQPDVKMPMDPAVRTGKLKNGFTYYIRHNEEPKSRVVMYLANKVGSILEDEDQRGLAHFMEHMSFNGTAHFPKNKLVDYLQKSGVRFGADLNAYTNYDETVYQLPLPSDNPGILSNGLQIMRDWAQSATLDPVEIDKERGVVLEEKRLGKGAQERMQRQILPIILNNSRYAVRTPIGLDTVLNNFRPETIRRFYHDWYRPDLQALIVVGDIDVNKMEQAIKAKFSDLKNPLHERKRTRYEVALNDKNEFITVTDKEMTRTNIEVLIKGKGGRIITTSDYRRNILNDLFNGMIGARYAELIQQADAPFIEGSAAIGSFTGGLSMFSVAVAAKPNELERGFKAGWREIERVKRFGFTDSELERARLNYLNNYQELLKEKNKTSSASFVTEYLANFLNGTASPGIDYEYKQGKAILASIKLEELNEMARSETKLPGRDVVIMAPDKDKGSLPVESVVNGWINAVEKEDLRQYQDEVSVQNLLSIVPSPGKIISRNYDKANKISTLVLSNGVKVLLKKTDFKNDEVLFNGFASGGTSLYDDKDYQSATAANIIPSFGVGNYNITELQKYLSSKELSVRPFIGDRTESIGGTSINRDLETAMQLIYAYFTSPHKDEELFKGIIDRSKASLTNRANDPRSVFDDTISAVLGNHNVRRTGPSLEKINQINLDKAFDIYKERFADASGFTFVFVGNIDTSAIQPLLEKYLGALPALHKGEQARDLHLAVPEGILTRTVYKGSEPRATVNLFLTGAFDYSFGNIIEMDALKEALEIRLFERLREDESGVYSPSVSISETKLPRSRFSLTVSFGCAPQNVEKLIASTLDEIRKIKQDGPSQINIEKFVAEEKRTTETQLSSNRFWLNYISTQVLNNEDLHQIDNLSTTLDGLTPEKLKAIANQYLSGKNRITIILMPEK